MSNSTAIGPVVFAIASAKWNAERTLDIERRPIRGTATPLAGDLLITALHVVQGLDGDSGQVAIIVLPQSDGSYEAGLIAVEAKFEDLDLAVISVADHDYPPHISLCMPTSEYVPKGGTSVSSLGFAHVTADHFFTRTLTGSLVSHQQAPDSLSQLATGVLIYELSYQCPRGLSGAPVLDEEGRLLGIVVGQQATESEVIYTTETITDDVHTEEFISKHYVTFGVAVDSREFLSREVRGRPLREILTGLGMRTYREHFGYR